MKPVAYTVCVAYKFALTNNVCQVNICCIDSGFVTRRLKRVNPQRKRLYYHGTHTIGQSEIIHELKKWECSRVRQLNLLIS